MVYNIYFCVIFGLASAINDYLRLKIIRVVCVCSEFLTVNDYQLNLSKSESDLFLYTRNL